MSTKVVSTVDVPQPREEVFAFLDVMANHEAFTDHMLRDWALSGPPSGVGAVAEVKGPGGQRARIEVLEAEPGRRILEQGVGAGGKRRTQGVYELEDLPGGGTRVTFTFELLAMPVLERPLAPLARRMVKQGNDRAMARLREVLAARVPATAGA